MNLTGLHLLLSYQCTFECDHCFVWGSPWQTGTMTLESVRNYLDQAEETGTVEWIYFEGGEPFLYYPLLLRSVQMAYERGFKVGVVSNAYWAISEETAIAALEPFAGLLHDLTISSDLFHYNQKISQQARHTTRAAELLDIPLGVITISAPECEAGKKFMGMLPAGESRVMFRGRAAEKLSSKAPHHPWKIFTHCPEEDLVDPGRVHLDPYGYIHICQGIVLGNLQEIRLSQLCREYSPESHPILGPLLSEGPAGLVCRYNVATNDQYADACHLCYEARVALRDQFPSTLCPDPMYGRLP